MILITTVWHTGTHSLIAELAKNYKRFDKGTHYLQMHCCKGIQRDLDLYTTYRDPRRVAASWVNRGRNDKHPRINRKWFDQWDVWAEIYPQAKVFTMDDLSEKQNKHDDRFNLHQSILEGDWETYFEHVPLKWIEHAESLTREVHGV